VVDKERGDDGKTGSETEPVRTVSRALLLSEAGDEVVVREGRYWRIEVGGRARGKEGKRLVIRSEGKGKVVVQGGIEIKGEAGYVRVEGFEVVGEGVKVDGKENEVRDCYIHDLPGKTGIEVRGEGHRVVGNRIERVSFGMVVKGKGHLVEGNEISRLVWGSGVNDCDYIRFFGEGHILRRNYLHGTKKEEVGVAHVDGWQTYAVNPGEYAKDILIEGNILTGYFMHGAMLEGKRGGRRSTVERIVIRNNAWAEGTCCINARGVYDLQIVNNTFKMALETISAGRVGGTVRVLAGPGIIFARSSDGTPTTGSVVNNILFDTLAYLVAPGDEDACVLLCGGNLVYTTSEHLFSKRTWPQDILNTDPVLLNAGNFIGPDGSPFTEDDGYRLKPTSPCVDTGEETDLVTQDIYGAARPRGKRKDIGCHEL